MNSPKLLQRLRASLAAIEAGAPEPNPRRQRAQRIRRAEMAALADSVINTASVAPAVTPMICPRCQKRVTVAWKNGVGRIECSCGFTGNTR